MPPLPLGIASQVCDRSKDRISAFPGLGASPRALLATLAVVALGIAAFRVARLSSMEPRPDQAYFAVWIQDIRESHHFLPVRTPGESFRSALEADSSSTVHQIALRLYNKHHNLYTLVPVAALSILLRPFDVRYETQVAATIAVSALLIVIAPSFLLLSAAKDAWRVPRAVAVLIGAAAAAGCAYLHYFSAFGVHNFGIAVLYAAALAIERLMNPVRRGYIRPGWLIAAVSLATLAALFSHWTNVFVLPVACAARFIVNGCWSLTARWNTAIAYCLLVAVIAGLPFAVLSMTGGGASEDLTYARLSGGDLILGAFARAGSWFSTGAALFSSPGLALALPGVVLLAALRGVWMPALITAAHFALWCAMPGFSWNGSNSGLRTYPYVLPALCIGLGYIGGITVRQLSRWRAARAWRLAVVTLCCAVVTHFIIEVRALVDPLAAEARMPDFWSDFMVGQGQLRPAVRAAEKALWGDGYLLAWDYSLKYAFQSLAGKPLRGSRLPAVRNLLQRVEAGDVAEYIRARRLSTHAADLVVLVAPGSVSVTDQTAALAKVLGQLGASLDGRRPEHLGSWHGGSDSYGTIVLHRFPVARRSGLAARHGNAVRFKKERLR